MNEVVPDWLHREDVTKATTTSTPNTTIWGPSPEAQRIASLVEEIERLKAENAELREKCMTRFERIQKASPEQMAATIAFIYDIGYTDGREDADDDHHWLEWLQEIGTI